MCFFLSTFNCVRANDNFIRIPDDNVVFLFAASLLNVSSKTEEERNTQSHIQKKQQRAPCDRGGEAVNGAGSE